VTPVDGTRGLLLTIEASRPPEVSCRCFDGLVQLSPLGQRAHGQGTGAHDDYLVPPGCTLTRISIDGRRDRDARSEVPPGQYLRVTRAAIVETWRVTAERSLEVTIDPSDHTYLVRELRVRSSSQPFFRTSVEPGGDGTRLSGVSARGPVGRAENYELTVVGGGDDARILRGTVRVTATVFGVCEPGCVPPNAADALQLDDPSAP